MANYRVGDIIRMTRNSYGINQEELCFGICSVETLSRIENGKHNVKKNTYQQLMARMERNSEKYYSICTGKDMEILEERIILENLMLKYKYEEADKYIENIKRKVSDNILNNQYLKNTEALLDYYNKRIIEE